MSEKQYYNSGTLWKNDYKEEGDRKPDLKGKITVEGQEFEIAAWSKTKPDGSGKFLSLSVQRPRQRQEG